MSTEPADLNDIPDDTAELDDVEEVESAEEIPDGEPCAVVPSEGVAK